MADLFTHNYNRRDFLGKSLLGSALVSPFAAFAGNPSTIQTPANMDPKELISVQLPLINDPTEQKEPELPSVLRPAQRLGYCIVGLGHLSLAQILPQFSKCKYARPVALVSGDGAKAAKVSAQYGIQEKNIYNYQNFDNIRDNKEIDIVYIVLPNAMHEEYTIRAAKAGKHVLCEKPMTTSAASAQRMIDACKQAGRKLMIAYRIQYEPFNKMAMQWTRSKEYGRVRLIESYNGQNIGDPTQWRLKKALAGGGCLPDIGLYNLNTTRYLLGEEPEWVSGQIYSTPDDPRFKEVEETMLFQMGFPSGAVAACSTSYGVHISRRYRCLTDKGAWYGLDPAFSYNGLKLELSQAKGLQEYKQQIEMGEKAQFALEMDHMAHCIINNLTPFTPGEEGLQDQKIMEAIYQSAREGRPIKLQQLSGTDLFRGSKPEEA